MNFSIFQLAVCLNLNRGDQHMKLTFYWAALRFQGCSAQLSGRRRRQRYRLCLRDCKVNLACSLCMNVLHCCSKHCFYRTKAAPVVTDSATQKYSQNQRLCSRSLAVSSVEEGVDQEDDDVIITCCHSQHYARLNTISAARGRTVTRASRCCFSTL
jgi:hypothetical protein